MTLLSKILLVVTLAACGAAFFMGLEYREIKGKSESVVEVSQTKLQTELERADSYKKKMNEALTDAEKVKKQIEVSQRELRDAQEKLARAEEDLKSHQSKSVADDAKIESIQAQLDEIQKDSRDLESKLFAKDDEISRLRDLMYVGPTKDKSAPLPTR
ncbi:MAG: hypothetical protein SGI71_00135 [Verrucomicrobiota bacterium]|nr:hypothetical protein [Verrucomicrobiota bacterium]